MLKHDILTISQIIDAFPDECKEMIPCVNRLLKKELKPYFDHVKSIEHRLYDGFTTGFLKQVIHMFYNPDKLEKVIRRNQMILDSLDAPKDDRITDLMIERAKDTPIATLYDFENIRSGHARYSARCPFHTEKTGSFFVYPNNTFYCFGCQAGGDAITFVRKLNGYKFPEAVKFLINQ